MENQVGIVLLQLPFSGIMYPHLGLALLKSYLFQNNISCKIFDVNAHAYCLRGDKYDTYWDLARGYDYCEDREKMLEYYKDNRALFLYYMNEIKKLNPTIVGCSCKNSSFILSQLFLEDLRNNIPHYKHILGGPEVAGFMKNADMLLSSDYIDAVNLDEGETSLVNYFRAVEKDTGEPVSGLVYKKDDHLIRGGPTNFIKNLDELPFADFSDFNLKQYITPHVLPTYTSRGCINKCIYCSSPSFMGPFRFRSGERIFQEIKHQKQKYPEVNYILTNDNLANPHIKELEKFCDLLIEAKLGIKWHMEDAVFRREMRTPLYKKLKKSGCTIVNYGLENPSKRLLAAIGKHTAKDVNIAQVLKEGKKSGIRMGLNIMFGLPGETEDDFMHLLELIRKNRRFIYNVIPSLTFCEFYPGSLGNQNPQKYGLDLTKGHLFWESVDGTNTYLTRMRRFETFCKMTKRYKLDNLLPNMEELPNKHKLLFNYYFVSKKYDNALVEYDKIVPEERTERLKKIYHAIKTKNFANLEENKRPLRNLLPYGDTFEETFIISSLSECLESLRKINIFRNMWLKPWQKKVRYLAHRAIGYDRIDKKIDNAFSILKIIDEKIKCSIENTRG